jgi:hypothetical protein
MEMCEQEDIRSTQCREQLDINHKYTKKRESNQIQGLASQHAVPIAAADPVYNFKRMETRPNNHSIELQT